MYLIRLVRTHICSLFTVQKCVRRIRGEVAKHHSLCGRIQVLITVECPSGRSNAMKMIQRKSCNVPSSFWLLYWKMGGEPRKDSLCTILCSRRKLSSTTYFGTKHHGSHLSLITETRVCVCVVRPPGCLAPSTVAKSLLGRVLLAQIALYSFRRKECVLCHPRGKPTGYIIGAWDPEGSHTPIRYHVCNYLGQL